MFTGLRYGLDFGRIPVTYMRNTGILGYSKEDSTFICPYCLRCFYVEEGTVDHIIPKSIHRWYIRELTLSEGLGVNNIRNKVLSCGYCNRRKSDQICIPLDKNGYLRHLPYRWQVQYAKYFYDCFTSGNNSLTNPKFFSENGKNMKSWKEFIVRYKKLIKREIKGLTREQLITRLLFSIKYFSIRENSNG